MKKSFMTRVLAVSLSAAMAFSLSSASNLMTASAANATVKLKTTFKTLKVKQTYKLTLTSNTLNWKITKVTTTNKQICTVYGKTSSYVMLKGKGVGRATIKVKTKTTKRKYPKNIKWMSCRVNVKEADQPVTPVTPEEFSISASASSNEKVTVTFSQAVDEATANNFTINGVTVTGVELSADKKTATLTISGAASDTEYTLSTSGLKVNGADAANKTTTFKTPPADTTITYDYQLRLTAADTVINSDGKDNTVLTCQLLDKDEKLVTDKEVEIRFTASRGKLAADRVTTEKGVAKNVFTSEFSAVERQSLITAVVENSNSGEMIGITTEEKYCTILMAPDKSIYDADMGLVAGGAESNEADRVTVYFDKEVGDVTRFLDGNGRINPNLLDVRIRSGLSNTSDNVNGRDVTAIGLVPVDGNPKAMEILVDRPLIDNSIVRVRVQDLTRKENTDQTVYFKLTDARQPSVLKVESQGYRTIRVEFSEAMNFSGADGVATGDGLRYCANDTNHYLIDGVRLSSATYGVAATTPANARVATYTGPNSDNRHVVELSLGRYSNGKRVYLTPGKHTLQVENVGDWASNTDSRNVMDTESFEFEVVEDTTVPDIVSVDVQSPEQYLVTFSAPVDKNVLSATFGRTDTNIATRKGKDGDSIIKMYEGNTKISEDKNPIVVTTVGAGNSVSGWTQYLVEVTRDWTEVYNTRHTTKNHYNYDYSLVIEEGAIENTNNGKTNSAIRLVLSEDARCDGSIGSIKVPDEGRVTQLTNGELVVDDALWGDYYRVGVNEPVKIGGYTTSDYTDGRRYNDDREGLTPSEDQAAGNGVPKPSADFISADNQTTIQGEILGFDRTVKGTQDMELAIRPTRKLTAGTWRLVVRSISDDVGNTTASLTHEFEVVQNVQAKGFRVLWAAVGEEDHIASAFSEEQGDNDGQRFIFVKFSDPIAITGTDANALRTTNYSLNSAELPNGTMIHAGINGYDARSAEKGGVVDSITIVLPSRAYDGVNSRNTVINLSKAITSASGQAISGETEIRMPYRFNWFEDGDGSRNANNNAIWGDHASEQFGAPGLTTAEDYMAALRSALDDDRYRTVKLSAFKAGEDLEVTRPVNIDLNGYAINDLTITFDNAATVAIYNSDINPANAATIEGDLIVNTPNADVILGGINTTTAAGAYDKVADLCKHVPVVGNEGKGVINVHGVIVRDVLPATLVNFANVKKVTITDSNGTAIENHGTIDRVVVDTTGDVRLEGPVKYDRVTVTAKAKLHIDALIENALTVEQNVGAITIYLDTNGKIGDGTAGAVNDEDIVFGNDVTIEAEDYHTGVLFETASVNATLLRQAATVADKRLASTRLECASTTTPPSIFKTTSDSAIRVVNVEVKDSAKSSNAKYLRVASEAAWENGEVVSLVAEEVSGLKGSATEYAEVTMLVDVNRDNDSEPKWVYITKEFAFTIRK